MMSYVGRLVLTSNPKFSLRCDIFTIPIPIPIPITITIPIPIIFRFWNFWLVISPQLLL